MTAWVSDALALFIVAIAIKHLVNKLRGRRGATHDDVTQQLIPANTLTRKQKPKKTDV